MGLAYFTSLRSWRARLAMLAELAGLRDEFSPVPDGTLAARPFRLIIVVWLLWGWYAVVKLYHGVGNLPSNWPGIYLAILGGLYVLWRFAGDPWLHQRLLLCLTPVSSAPASAQSARAWPWFCGGLALVAANLALLEFRHPFTFTHDDNLSQFLPVIVHGARSLFDEGIFPTWNPHQFTVFPTASLGIYSFTYPPTYLAYAIARFGLGNEYATMEVFGILHLAGGFATMFWASRTIGMRPALAAAAALCFALCGYFLVAGRSWYYMLPLATWLPLLAVAVWYLQSRVGWKWVLLTGAVLGIIFHAGNAQMWVYSVGFVGVAAMFLVLYGGRSWKLLVPVSCAALLGLAIAAPLFVPQVLETAGLERFAGGEPIMRGLWGLVAPWPLSFADRPGMAETKSIRYMTQFYYGGTIFTVAAAIGVFSCLWQRWPRRIAAANVLLAMALVAFLYGLGRPGMVWGITGELPVFKQFRHPMKYLAFIHLFGMLGGGLIIERLLRRHPRVRLEWLVAGACAVLMSYHTFLALPAFFSWSITPYPAPPQWLAAAASDKSSRIYPVAPRRCTAGNYELSQMVHLPTVYGTMSLTGYDPLVEENRQQQAVRQRLIERPLAALRAYGVRRIVVYPTQELPVMYPGHNYFRWYYWEPPERAAYSAVKEAGRMAHWTPGAALYEIDDADPLAFVAGEDKTPLPIRFDAGGASVDLAKRQGAGSVVVNLVPPRFLRIAADGQRVEYTTDKWGRVELSPPPGARTLRLSYSPPWLAGSLLGLCLAGASLGGFAWFRQHDANAAQAPIEESRPCDEPSCCA